MKKRIIMVLMVLGWLVTESYADIKPTAIYMEDGVEVRKDEDFTAEAPLEVRFEANASDLDAGATLEWHFSHQGAEGSSNVTRYEENTTYTFYDAGVTVVALYVRQENELVDSAKINVTIYDSQLEMPNAFTPNGDGVNDTYSAKRNHRSIVEFHAYIFNRWGLFR